MTIQHDLQLQQLLAAVGDHQLTVLHEDGLYRHLRFKNPGSSMYYFDLITWPGYLTITGDLQTYTFSRLPDMLEFFRSPAGHINPGYWGEKLRAHSGYRTYSPDRLRALAASYFADRKDELDDPDATWAAIQRDVLDDPDHLGESEAHSRLNQFSFRGFEFWDTWEWDLRDYDHHFLLCCHAIVWGIAQYDQARLVAA